MSILTINLSSGRLSLSLDGLSELFILIKMGKDEPSFMLKPALK